MVKNIARAAARRDIEKPIFYVNQCQNMHAESAAHHSQFKKTKAINGFVLMLAEGPLRQNPGGHSMSASRRWKRFTANGPRQNVCQMATLFDFTDGTRKLPDVVKHVEKTGF
jgi:hypothetical protein